MNGKSDRLQAASAIPFIKLIKCVDDEVYTSCFFNFRLIFRLGLALTVVAPFDFDLYGFALDCSGDVGGAFGHG